MSAPKIHPTALVDAPCQIGENTVLWQGCHLMAGCSVGRNCSLGQNVVVSPGVSVGDGVRIQNNVSLFTGVTVEEDVFLGPGCVFTNVRTPRSFLPRKDAFLPTLVKRGASIGGNATILCGVTIGEYALVGAGAVVTRDVPPYGLVYGNPARLRGYVCRCGLPLRPGQEGLWACEGCSSRYRLVNGSPSPVPYEKGCRTREERKVSLP